ncbi:hypothetical protein ACHAXR_001067 [Thalassiosira sp. AJA248-18]
MHTNCDAIHFWRSLEYWRLAVGEETPVEAEIGKSYNSGNRMPMRFGDYLDYLKQVQHEKLEQEVAYLAQNELFPQVSNDIPIPQLCDDENGEYNIGEGKLYHTMLWMGPRHTVSPLHFDPLDNILMQVVGWKRVLMFPPDNQSRHYAGAKGNQYNTSAIDIENLNSSTLKQFPNFKALAPTPYECILGPGDGLYIPKKWWHHVRSLEMSVSANVWWR